ncbi:MAG: hypothetical protein NWF03_04635 [Candidatus Bathyarchaeota archaeon]|nr:hypothetical protein [Candidatus Bathyarchaeota archaeon]
MTTKLNETLKQNVLKLCQKIAGSRKITAACLYGPWVCGYADKQTDLNVLLVLDNFTFRVNTYKETVDNISVSVLMVNRSDFERDINRGWLGEFFAEKITVPYEPLTNPEYLRLNQIKTKKRVILELLENLILGFPESSHEFLINNQYFMYEVMLRRARVFPPLTYSFHNMLTGAYAQKNLQTIMDGYLAAINELVTENVLTLYNGYIKITKNHIEKTKKRILRLPPIFKTIQRLALPPLLSVFSESETVYIDDQRLFQKNNKKYSAERLVSMMENPKKHVFLPTPLGPVPLADKSNIKEIARKIIPDSKTAEMSIRNIGGVLNDVYLLTVTKDSGQQQKFVIKQFKDWSNLKWLPLTLWSFGSSTFVVLGQSRLEKEYAISTFLYNNGFSVPKIYHISPNNRIIVEEFIQGTDFAETIKKILGSKYAPKDLQLVNQVGQKVAKAHNLGVCLGDCKPENFLVTKNEIYVLDLEQATRNGNQAWDIAEFLYFSGHYSPPMSSATAATQIAKNFIQGYLDAGGNKESIKKAASARYTKVFSVFTPPHVLLAVSNVCQKMGK